MSLRIRILTGVAGVCAALLGVAATGRTQAQEPVPLAHNVFFTLKDSSEAAKDRLVNGCRKYLQGHPGELFFAAGTLVRETPLKNGLKHGREFTWTEDGHLELIEPYFEGKIHGTAKQYDDQGHVIGEPVREGLTNHDFARVPGHAVRITLAFGRHNGALPSAIEALGPRHSRVGGNPAARRKTHRVGRTDGNAAHRPVSPEHVEDDARADPALAGDRSAS